MMGLTPSHPTLKDCGDPMALGFFSRVIGHWLSWGRRRYCDQCGQWRSLDSFRAIAKPGHTALYDICHRCRKPQPLSQTEPPSSSSGAAITHTPPPPNPLEETPLVERSAPDEPQPSGARSEPVQPPHAGPMPAAVSEPDSTPLRQLLLFSAETSEMLTLIPGATLRRYHPEDLGERKVAASVPSTPLVTVVFETPLLSAGHAGVASSLPDPLRSALNHEILFTALERETGGRITGRGHLGSRAQGLKYTTMARFVIVVKPETLTMV